MLHINRQSFPISLQMGMESGAFTVSGIMAGWLGAVDLATYQVMITLGGLGFLLYYRHCRLAEALAICGITLAPEQ